jgi:nucleoside-diphosphate-sugar epimerase
MDNFKEFYLGKRILVTGADGFMGSHLTEKLLSYNANVSVYVRRELKNLKHAEKKLNIIFGNLEDNNSIDLIEKDNPQIIFHLAANDSVPESIKDPVKVYNTNINTTKNVLEASRKLRDLEKLVITSSCVVYGTNFNKINENDALKPNTPYAASKASSELLAYSYHKTFKLPITIIRPFNVYGPRKHKDVIPIFINKALKNEDIKLEGGGKATRDFNYIDDIVNAFLVLGMNKNSLGETINFGSGKDTSIRELAEKIIKYCNSDSKLIDVEERPGQDLRSLCDNSKAKNLFNWENKISLDEGLKLTIDYFKTLV